RARCAPSAGATSPSSPPCDPRAVRWRRTSAGASVQLVEPATVAAGGDVAVRADQEVRRLAGSQAEPAVGAAGVVDQAWAAASWVRWWARRWGTREIGWSAGTGGPVTSRWRCGVGGGGGAGDADGRVGQAVTGPWTPPVPAGGVGAEGAVAVGDGELGAAAEGAGAGRARREGGAQQPRGESGACGAGHRVGRGGGAEGAVGEPEDGTADRLSLGLGGVQQRGVVGVCGHLVGNPCLHP